MKPYPAYKNSGLSWLGKVPKHWQTEKLKFNARVRFSNVNKKTEEGEIPVKLCNYVDVYYNSEIGPDIEFMEASASLEEIEKFQLKAGDVLITKDSEEWTDIAVPAHVGVNIPNLLCGYHLAQIRSGSRLNGDFLFWLLSSNQINYQFKIEASGVTRYGLSNHALNNSLVLLPPVEEQKKLASFLKRKIAQIDDLISKKEKLIELLNEERAAIINQAVTKGLNPKVELKDSGIPWLGKIPKHWGIKRIKHVAMLKSGDGIKTELIKESAAYPVYGGNGLRGYADSYTHSGNYVLIGRQGALCGNINYANGKFWASEHAIVVTINERMNMTWLAELLRVMNLNQYSQSAAQPGLAVDNIREILIPVPPVNEQQPIAQHLVSKIAQNTAQIEQENKSIKHLKEYRTALISEVVTGKIDVRGI